jgi:hypothetical protein
MACTDNLRRVNKMEELESKSRTKMGITMNKMRRRKRKEGS